MFLICLSMLILPPPLGGRGSTQKGEGLRLNEEEAKGGRGLYCRRVESGIRVVREMIFSQLG